ncbi:MAG: phosphoenolpyruvate carboxylase [Parvibaculales bacterium]
MSYLPLSTQDPHVNPIKLLAYSLSEDLETDRVSMNDLEALLCDLNQQVAHDRGEELARRAGVDQVRAFTANYKKLLAEQADKGFVAFKAWVEEPAIGLVVTAHPTFALSGHIRDIISTAALGQEAAGKIVADDILKTTPPSLKEEHVEALACINQMQNSIDRLNAIILKQARLHFPDQWQDLSPNQVTVASWVGYDLDGRNDIGWADTIRLKLSEKMEILQIYMAQARSIKKAHRSDIPAVFDKFMASLEAALGVCEQEQARFESDLGNKSALVEAANFLTQPNPKRWLDNKRGLRWLDRALTETRDVALIEKIVVLKSRLHRCGLGAATLHLRANAMQVISAIGEVLPVTMEERLDSRTLLEKVDDYATHVTPVETNFATLEAETGTVRMQFILARQILQHIDREMPIRYLIAETDQPSIIISALGLARYYGVDHRVDISPLFETPNALRNGGRVVARLLEQPSYRAYIQKRKTLCLQTGFSDAGRFIGQIPATLSIERLQSHVARALARSKLKNIRTIIFNTHGESIGRGGHPGTLKQRVNYIMSPWVFHKFGTLGLKLTHEFSFQGGDGYLWFANKKLANASLMHLICARFEDVSAAGEDGFYADADFIWDFYNEIITQQDSLYRDSDYRYLLSGFARNFLIPSGSRPEIRQASGPLAQSTFTPRMIRAIPHNALLQQVSVPANVIFGLGRAMRIDIDRFASIFSSSPRARNLLEMILGSWQGTHLQALTAYGDLQDPNFWISRAMSHPGENIYWRYRVIANQLYQRNAYAKLRQLIYRVRADGELQSRILSKIDKKISMRMGPHASRKSQNQMILHALRLALLMHAQSEAAAVPVNAPPGATRSEIVEKACNYDLDLIVKVLKKTYPASPGNMEWQHHLSDSATLQPKPRQINSLTIERLEQCSRLVKLVNQGLMHANAAYG